MKTLIDLICLYIDMLLFLSGYQTLISLCRHIGRRLIGGRADYRQIYSLVAVSCSGLGIFVVFWCHIGVIVNVSWSLKDLSVQTFYISLGGQDKSSVPLFLSLGDIACLRILLDYRFMMLSVWRGFQSECVISLLSLSDGVDFILFWWWTC